jgi:LmbE family N-acetylglucosaminyl deacetylase
MLSPAVFFSPHQDDELLSMGPDILRHLAAGHDTHVVLMTEGGDTSARWSINGYDSETGRPVSSGWWGGRHDPALEGYAPLTWDDVYDARDREFRSCLGALGVPESNRNLLRTPDRTVPGFKETIRGVLMQFPAETICRTLSPLDTHDDHRAIAQALWELWDEGVVSDAAFWLSRFDLIKERVGSSHLSPATTDAELKTIEQATRAYRAWNPSAGSYAVGYHSVPGQFSAMLSNPEFRYFTPTQFTKDDLPF